MNPAHDPASHTEHHDLDTLADLAEGLLDADRAASVDAHLESCDECRDRSADLADVSRILAQAPVPSMPADLASRIDSAIAAESLNDATVVSLGHRRGRRHWRIMSAAAATVVVLGGGGVVGYAVLDGSPGEQSAATPPADAVDRGEPTPRAPAETGGSGVTANSAPGYRVSSSGTAYRAATLDAQVSGMLDQVAQPRSVGRPPDPGLRACVSAVAGSAPPALVDTGTYEGRPATVIAAPSGTPDVMDIWVVAADCSPGNTQVLKRSRTSTG